MDAALVGAMLQRLDVALGEIHHVDVVAYPCAIRGFVIVSKDREAVAATDGDPGQKGHEVVRDALGILSQGAGLVAPTGLK